MDWDADGKLDIISGCYWTDGTEAGHLQILKGAGDMQFEASKSIQSMAGKPLQNMKLAKGDEDPELTSNICTQQHAVDYDADGDLDLVVGCFGSKFFFYENKSEQNGGKNSLVEWPVTLPLESTGYHSAPHLADWDNDGDLDFLSGAADGGVLISINSGTREKPVWSDFQQLVEPPNKESAHEQRGDDVTMAASTRVWTTDFNDDGLLDLLVGDSVTLIEPKGGITDAEFVEKLARQKKQLAEISKKQQELMDLGDEADQAEMAQVTEQLMKIYNVRSEFMDSKRTGHVWLLIRQSDGS